MGVKEEHVGTTIHVAENQTCSSCAKRVALRCCCIREINKEGHASIRYIPMEKHPADLGTKFLYKRRDQF